jgi:hypothetical protein
MFHGRKSAIDRHWAGGVEAGQLEGPPGCPVGDGLSTQGMDTIGASADGVELGLDAVPPTGPRVDQALGEFRQGADERGQQTERNHNATYRPELLGSAKGSGQGDGLALQGEGEPSGVVLLGPWVVVGEGLEICAWSVWRAVPIVNKLFGEEEKDASRRRGRRWK